MVNLEDVSGMLRAPSDVESSQPPPNRASSTYKPLDSFVLPKEKSYKQQYADIYFLRLTKIKPAVESIAAEAWEGTVIGDEPAKKVHRVLDVRQGELCWVAGTVFMDMPLKPDILEDVSKDRWISAPTSARKYYSDDDRDQVMLEDDSGRIMLVGDMLKTVRLVTGCIIAIMGTENANGELEVIDIKFPDLSPQPERWALHSGSSHYVPGQKNKDRDEDEEMADGSQQAAKSKGNSRMAIVSGLSFSSTDPSYAVELNLLLEYLLGEALDPTAAQKEISNINRLVIAGNSISTAEASKPPTDATADKNGTAAAPATTKKYGYDSASYNPLPSQLFDEFLSDLLPSMPVTLFPGAQDPANASYPQQPIHPAMFPRSRAWCAEPGSKDPGWFDSVTNPWEAEVDGWRVLGTGGQNVDDVFKYVDTDDRLGMMEAMCRWRLSAPTAPDTLWCYPFQDDDPFVMQTAPHLYFVGCQPEFSTKLIQGTDGQAVRLVTVPCFSETKEVVLVDTETMEVTKVKIMTA